MPITLSTSDYNTVTGTSQELPIAMQPGVQYVFRSDTACYIKIGATTATTASAADNSHFCPADVPIYVAAISTTEKYLAVIRKTADGICTLSRMDPGSIK